MDSPVHILLKKFRMMIFSGLIMASGTGCTILGPNPATPNVNVPARFQSAGRMLPAENRIDPGRWWEQLHDPVLTDLIQQATTGNIGLKEALARVRQARLQHRISRSDLYPAASASAAETTTRTGDDTRDLYTAGIDASWEIDIFGKTRRSIEAAQADWKAAEAAFRDVMVSLTAEVGLTYIEYRTFQAQYASTHESIAILSDTLSLAEARYVAGLSTYLDVKQAESSLEILRASVPTIETGLARSRFRLAVLLGDYPGAVDRIIARTAPLPDIPAAIATGIPADLLTRRPDIRQAEQNLAARTARIGVAMAERYPSVTLSGSIGLDAFSLDDLFTGDSRTSSFGPRIFLPIFNAGALKSAVGVQESLADQAFLQYRSTVLAAVEEVENALVFFAQSGRRATLLAAAREAAVQSVQLSEDQYASGLADFQRVLDAQRSLISINDQIIQNRGDMVSGVIRLYKALGGGWEM